MHTYTHKFPVLGHAAGGAAAGGAAGAGAGAGAGGGCRYATIALLCAYGRL